MINVLNKEELINKKKELEERINNENITEEERLKIIKRLNKHNQIIVSLLKCGLI